MAHKTRESWLDALVVALRPMFKQHGKPIPKKVRASCGFPVGKRSAIGQAWSSTCSADKTHETFISPTITKPVEVAEIMVHELVHHAVGVEHGHKKPFGDLARALGLEGKLTATYAGKELRAALTKLVKPLGKYPHGAMSPTNLKKQSTRMLKVQCPECECTVRMTRKWLDEVGCPTCACGIEMEEA